MMHQRTYLRARRRIVYVVVGFLSLLIGCLVIFPIFYAFCTSFMSASELTSWPPKLLPERFTYLDNYRAVLTKTKMPRFMFNSLVLAGGGTLLRLVTASLAAFSFSFYEYRGRNALFFLILGSMMSPGDAVVISNYVNVSRMGLMDTYLGLIVVYGVSATNVFMMRQYMRTLPTALRDASLIDGCSDMRFFLHVVLPCATPVLFSVGISSFVNLWNAYIWPLLITNREEMRVVQVGVTMLSTEDDPAYGRVMAAVSLILVPSILVFVLFQRRIVSGITTGSVMG